MEFLSIQSSAPLLCAGDFNECLDAQEQFGGVTRPERQMDGFRDAVNTCGFTDLGFWDYRILGTIDNTGQTILRFG